MRPRCVGFVVTFALGLLGAPLWANGIDARDAPRIVILRIVPMPSPSDPTFWRPNQAFSKELRNHGYWDDFVKGGNVIIQYYWGDGRADRLSGLAAELRRAKVSVFVTGSDVATQAVRQATTTIPIVMAGVGYAMEGGFVASLARPGGNATGVSSPAQEGRTARFR